MILKRLFIVHAVDYDSKTHSIIIKDELNEILNKENIFIQTVPFNWFNSINSLIINIGDKDNPQFSGFMKNLYFYYNIKITHKIRTRICKKCKPGKIADSLTNSCILCYENCQTCIGNSSGMCTSCKLDYIFLLHGFNENGNFGFCIKNTEIIQLKKLNKPFINQIDDSFIILNKKEKYYQGFSYDFYFLFRYPFKNHQSYFESQ